MLISVIKFVICSSIYLTPIGEQLDEVVVTGYTTTGVDRRKDGSFDVTQKSLGILPGLPTPDILRSLQMIPGISSPDESVSGIQIRGGSPDQNLIQFENIKMYGSSYFYGMLSSFSPYSTGKATIFKSGASAEYGDRISGVIDISLENAIPKKTSLGLGLDGLSIDALYGLTPKPYRHVTKLITDMGFELRGTLPQACYLARQKRYVPGVISVLDLTQMEGHDGRQDTYGATGTT